jgi:hypothetical protein
MLVGAPLGAYGGILFVAAAALHRAPSGSWFAVSVLILLAFVGTFILAMGALLVARRPGITVESRAALAIPGRGHE